METKSSLQGRDQTLRMEKEAKWQPMRFRYDIRDKQQRLNTNVAIPAPASQPP